MSEKKLNAVLYIILAAVVLLYFYFNVFSLGLFGAVLAGNVTAESLGGKAKMVTELNDVKQKKAEMADAEITEVETAEVDTAEDESSIAMHGESLAAMRNINPTGYHIYVDLDLTQMYVYKDGEQIKTYDVSGGKASSPSPVGTWKIINKDTWGEGFGGAWLGFNVPWGIFHQEHI